MSDSIDNQNAPSGADDPTERGELLRVWGPAVVLAILGFALAWQFAGAAPPRSIRLATGADGGGYAAAGAKIAAELAGAGVEVVLVETAGSQENLELLRAGDVDVALVQGGLATPEEDAVAGVVSLYLEPLWIFARYTVNQLDELEGMRLDLGSEGSGTRALAGALLGAAGVSVSAAPGEADQEAEGRLRVGAARSEPIRTALDPASGWRAADLDRAEGIARTLPFLRAVTVERGAVDLAADLPRETLRTVAPAANLLSSKDLHPAIIGLLMEATKVHFAGRGAVENEGEFPTLALLDVPPSLAARRAFERGPSFLYRWLPFQAAALVDRLKILLLPILTLLFPLFRMAPPLYRWRIRRRILLWYKRVMELEGRLKGRSLSTDELREAVAEFDRFDDELATVKVPLGYADELFHLRLHLRMVREDLEAGRGRWSRARFER